MMLLFRGLVSEHCNNKDWKDPNVTAVAGQCADVIAYLLQYNPRLWTVVRNSESFDNTSTFLSQRTNLAETMASLMLKTKVCERSPHFTNIAFCEFYNSAIGTLSAKLFANFNNNHVLTSIRKNINFENSKDLQCNVYTKVLHTQYLHNKNSRSSVLCSIKASFSFSSHKVVFNWNHTPDYQLSKQNQESGLMQTLIYDPSCVAVLARELIQLCKKKKNFQSPHNSALYIENPSESDVCNSVDRGEVLCPPLYKKKTSKKNQIKFNGEFKGVAKMINLSEKKRLVTKSGLTSKPLVEGLSTIIPGQYVVYKICNYTSCQEQEFVFPFYEKPFKLQPMSVSPCRLQNSHKNFPDKHPSKAKELDNFKIPYELKRFDLSLDATALDQLNRPNTLRLGCPLLNVLHTMTMRQYFNEKKDKIAVLPVVIEDGSVHASSQDINNEDDHFQFPSTQDTNVSTRYQHQLGYRSSLFDTQDTVDSDYSYVAMFDQANPHTLTQDTNVHLLNPFPSSSTLKVNLSQKSFEEAFGPPWTAKEFDENTLSTTQIEMFRCNLPLSSESELYPNDCDDGKRNCNNCSNDPNLTCTYLPTTEAGLMDTRDDRRSNSSMSVGLNDIRLNKALSKNMLETIVVTTHISNVCNHDQQEVALRTARKIRSSCEPCREKKSKCDQERPSKNCTATYRTDAKMVCHYEPVQKSGPKAFSAAKEPNLHNIMMGQIGMRNADPRIVIPQNTTPGIPYWASQVTPSTMTYAPVAMSPPTYEWDNPMVRPRALFPPTATSTDDTKHAKKYVRIQKATLIHLLGLRRRHHTDRKDLEIDVREERKDCESKNREFIDLTSVAESATPIAP
eukprot:jgi/Psemu1/8924/gm1.8924_g